MPSIAIVTSIVEPQLKTKCGDHFISEYLSSISTPSNPIQVTAAPWNNPRINWRSFDAIVIRSPDDYHKEGKHVEFVNWLNNLETVEAEGVVVMNSVATLRWNMHKTYLRDLEKRGLPKGVELPITLWFTEECVKESKSFSLQDELAIVGLEKAVVKPTIGADGHFQWVFHSSNPLEEKFKTQLLSHPLMAQQFVQDIADQWELKLIFLNRVFIRGMIKPPSHHVEDGLHESLCSLEIAPRRETTPCVPPPTVVKRASEVLDLIPGRLSYARVDVVLAQDDRLYLMEIELLEPELFLDEAGGKLFGDHILDSIRERERALESKRDNWQFESKKWC